MEVAGVPLIMVGRSGENIGKTELQVWEKVNMPLKEETPKARLWEEGRWLICTMLSVLFVLENILVNRIGLIGEKTWIDNFFLVANSCNRILSSMGGVIDKANGILPGYGSSFWRCNLPLSGYSLTSLRTLLLSIGPNSHRSILSKP